MSEKRDFYDYLGLAAIILAISLGVGSCTLMANVGLAYRAAAERGVAK